MFFDWLKRVREERTFRLHRRNPDRCAAPAEVCVLESRQVFSQPELSDLAFAVTTSNLTGTAGVLSGTITDLTPSTSGYSVQVDWNADGSIDTTGSFASGSFSWQLSAPPTAETAAVRTVEVQTGLASAWTNLAFSPAVAVDDLGFQARDDYYVLRGESTTAVRTLAVLANDSNDQKTALSITSVSAASHGTVSIGYSQVLQSDVLLYSATNAAAMVDSFTYTATDALGRSLSATVQVRQIPRNESGVGGGTGPTVSANPLPTVLDGTLDLDPTRTLNIALPSNRDDVYSASSVLSTQQGGRSYSGTQSLDQTAWYWAGPNGDWSYAETVFWTYDISAENSTGSTWHAWGHYTYTLIASKIGSVRSWYFDFSSADHHSNTLVYDSGNASAGSTISITDTGSATLGAVLSNVTDVSAGTSTGADFEIRVSQNSYTGGGSYWRNQTGGALQGTLGAQGGQFDFSTVALVYTSLTPGSWIVGGNTIGRGQGSDSESFQGAGSFSQTSFSGTNTESGSERTRHHYDYFSVLQPGLGWFSSGSGERSGTSANGSNFVGSGWYSSSGLTTNSGGAVIGGWERSGTNDAQGGQSLQGSYHLDLKRGAQGWTITNGTASQSGESNEYTSFSGGGTYRRNENGGLMTGTLWDQGFTRSSNDYQVQAAYSNGNWISWGSASGQSSGDKKSSYSGSGDYVDGYVEGSAFEHGKDYTKTSRESTSRLGDNGWVLESGSGTDHGDSDNFRSYFGYGASASVKTVETRVNDVNTEKWQSGFKKGRSDFDKYWDVVNHAWQATSGNGSGSGRSLDFASTSASGTYEFTINDGLIEGTLSGSGSESNSSRYDTLSTWTGTAWSTSGTSRGAASGRSNSRYSGTGTYSRTRGQQSGSGNFSTIAGTMFEDGSEKDDWSNTSVSDLNSVGKWILSSGSGSGSGKSTAFLSISGAGQYRQTKFGSPSVATPNADWWVEGTLSENRGSDSTTTNRKQMNVANHEWVTTGSSSGSGTVWSIQSASGAGEYEVQTPTTVILGDLLHTDNSRDLWTFKTQGQLNPTTKLWSLTSGSASGTSTALTDFRFVTSTGTETVDLNKPKTYVLDFTTPNNWLSWSSASGSITYDVTAFNFFRNTSDLDYQMRLNPAGEWKLFTATGYTTDTAGDGVERSGTGSETVWNATRGLNPLNQASSIVTSEIEDETLNEIGLGELATRNFANGQWTVSTGSAYAHGRDYANKETESSGTYTTTFVGQNLTVGGDATVQYQYWSGSIAGTSSGSGQQLEDYTWDARVNAAGVHGGRATYIVDDWAQSEYSGSGGGFYRDRSHNSPADFDGTWSESGDRNANFSTTVNVQRNASGDWSFQSGTRSEYEFSQDNSGFSGSRLLDGSGVDDDGGWDATGTEYLNFGGNSWATESASWTLNTSGSWTPDTAHRSFGASQNNSLSGSASGNYALFLGDGTLVGTYSNRWKYDKGQQYALYANYASGSWSKSGWGYKTTVEDTASHYSGAGSYTATVSSPGVRLNYSGSISEHGDTSRLYNFVDGYSYIDDQWFRTTGLITLDSDNVSGYSFSGSGTASIDAPSGYFSGSVWTSGSSTITGNASEHGGASTFDNFLGQKVWNPTWQRWDVVGQPDPSDPANPTLPHSRDANGNGGYSAHYHSSYSASGDVLWNVDRFGPITVHADRAADNGWTFDETWDYGYSGNRFTFNSSGSGSSSNYTFTRNSASGASGDKTLRFDLGSEQFSDLRDEWTDGTLSGLDYSAVTSGSGHTWGNLSFSHQWTEGFDYSSGHYLNVSQADRLQSLDVSFDAHTYASGGRTIDENGDREWSFASGSAVASGHAIDNYSGTTTVTASWANNESSGYENSLFQQIIHRADHFQQSGSWSRFRDVDGSVTNTGSLTNHRSGTYHDVYTFSTDYAVWVASSGGGGYSGGGYSGGGYSGGGYSGGGYSGGGYSGGSGSGGGYSGGGYSGGGYSGGGYSGGGYSGGPIEFILLNSHSASGTLINGAAYNYTTTQRGFASATYTSGNFWDFGLWIGDGFQGTLTSGSEFFPGPTQPPNSGNPPDDPPPANPPTNPPTWQALPAFKNESGDILTISTPTISRTTLDLDDFTPPVVVKAKEEPGPGTTPPDPTANPVDPWEWVVSSVAFGPAGDRKIREAAADGLNNLGDYAAEYLTNLGAWTGNETIAIGLGFAGGGLRTATGVLGGLVTPERSIEGAINTYSTYYNNAGGGWSGVSQGLGGVLGTNQLAEAMVGYDILDGHKLNGDELFDRSVGGFSSTLAVVGSFAAPAKLGMRMTGGTAAKAAGTGAATAGKTATKAAANDAPKCKVDVRGGTGCFVGDTLVQIVAPTAILSASLSPEAADTDGLDAMDVAVAGLFLTIGVGLLHAAQPAAVPTTVPRRRRSQRSFDPTLEAEDEFVNPEFPTGQEFRTDTEFPEASTAPEFSANRASTATAELAHEDQWSAVEPPSFTVGPTTDTALPAPIDALVNLPAVSVESPTLWAEPVTDRFTPCALAVAAPRTLQARLADVRAQHAPAAHSRTRHAPAARPPRQRPRALLTALALLAFFAAGLSLIPRPQAQSTAGPVIAQHAAGVTTLARPIREITVGMAVPRVGNPSGEFDDEFGVTVEPPTWRLIKLRAAKRDGSFADVTLLRPLAWLEDQTGLSAEEAVTVAVTPLEDADFPTEFSANELLLTSATAVARIDITIPDPAATPHSPRGPPSDARFVGREISFHVPECGISGQATILAVEPCPPVLTGPDGQPRTDVRIVTGTFAHRGATVIDVALAGQPTVLGTTPNHPFWSEDRQRFVRADELRIGDRLRQLDGSFTTVASVHQRPGTHDVFNLEIQVDHVYHVGTGGVLVHNGTVGPGGKPCPDTPKPDEVLHFYHGTDVDSALHLLNRGNLDAAVAAAKKIDGKAGFFLATHFDDAAFFARRRGDKATVIRFSISRSAFEQLTKAGASRRPIPPGRTSRFDGDEFHIPPNAFEQFNKLRTHGEIDVVP